MSVEIEDESFAGPVATDSVPPAAVPETVATEQDHGRSADAPTQIPKAGMRDVLTRVKSEAKADHVPLLSAGVAFYALLAMVPGLVAIISIYGLVADPAQVRSQILDALSTAPREVRNLVSTQLESIASSSGAGTIVAVVIGIIASLYSASAGIGHLIDALNVAYDEQEHRNLLKRKALALGITVGAIVFVVAAIGVIAVLPALIADLGIGIVGRIAIGIVRWVVLFGGMVVGLSVLYRYGPDRDSPKWRWASPGAMVAALLWLVGSLVFSLYTANFAKYNDTYGSLGAVVVLMLWLFLTALSVILGGEVNAELERQTARDTTEGRAKPLGDRNAYAADTLGETADEVKRGRHGAGTTDHATGVATRRPALTPATVAGGVTFPLRIAGGVGVMSRLFGVRSDRAHVIVSGGWLSVRYGRWILTTPVSNVDGVEITGPYAFWKVAGPPHVTFSDGGLTFATNADEGVCVSFREPVAGLLPYGLMKHPNLTFTPADPVAVRDALGGRTEIGSQPGVAG